MAMTSKGRGDVGVDVERRERLYRRSTMTIDTPQLKGQKEFM